MKFMWPVSLSLGRFNHVDMFTLSVLHDFA